MKNKPKFNVGDVVWFASENVLGGPHRVLSLRTYRHRRNALVKVFPFNRRAIAFNADTGDAADYRTRGCILAKGDPQIEVVRRRMRSSNLPYHIDNIARAARALVVDVGDGPLETAQLDQIDRILAKLRAALLAAQKKKRKASR